jgi:hypothetical protein
MRRMIRLAATAALFASLGAPATAGARPPSLTVTFTACRVDSTTVRLAVSWSNLAVTGGEFFINTAPLTTGYTSAWNQKAKHGSHTQDFNIGTDIADIVTVNLYNAKDPNNITFEQRVIGEGNDAEELLPC